MRGAFFGVLRFPGNFNVCSVLVCLFFHYKQEKQVKGLRQAFYHQYFVPHEASRGREPLRKKNDFFAVFLIPET